MPVRLSPRNHRVTVLKEHYDPGKVLNLREDGTVPLNHIRVLLFIALNLATLRSRAEIIRMTKEELKVTPTIPLIRKVGDWMERMGNDPDQKLHRDAKRWKEIYEQFILVREKYYADISVEPLAHPRGRFNKLKSLLDRAEEGVLKRIHIVKETTLDDDGNIRVNHEGKAILSIRTIAEREPDLPSAINIVKAMGHEAGNLVERHEHRHSWADLVKNQIRLNKEIQDAEYAIVLPSAIPETASADV